MKNNKWIWLVVGLLALAFVVFGVFKPMVDMLQEDGLTPGTRGQAEQSGNP